MTETTTIMALNVSTSANSVSKPTGAQTPADALGVTKRMCNNDDESKEFYECPTCGKGDLKTVRGLKVHHQLVHDERLDDSKRTVRGRFETKHNGGDPDECWEWTASTQGKGYGRIKINGRYKQAHRISYLLEYGSIPEGMWVLHHCDNKLCVNPAHLYAGTHKDNVQDAVDRNRRPRGEDIGSAKLSPGDVHKIRRLAEDESQRTVAEEFDIDQSTVSLIVNGKLWSHIS